MVATLLTSIGRYFPTAGVCMDTAFNEKTQISLYIHSVKGEIDYKNHHKRIYHMNKAGIPLDPSMSIMIVAMNAKKKCITSIQDKKYQITELQR